MSSVNVHIGRYAEEEADDYQGWIEPEDRSWILYMRKDHAPELFVDRDPKTGAVLGPDDPMPLWSARPE